MKINVKLKSKNGFYVGDVCYALSDEDYNGEWHNDFKEFEGVHELRGHIFAVVAVREDGTYLDQKGRLYEVNGGNIGVVPLELCQPPLVDLVNNGSIIFAKEGEFEGGDGRINISFDNGEEVGIVTSDIEEDEDEEGEQVFVEEENERFHYG